MEKTHGFQYFVAPTIIFKSHPYKLKIVYLFLLILEADRERGEAKG